MSFLFQSKDEEMFQGLGTLLDGCDVVLLTTELGTVSENEIPKAKISEALKNLDGKELNANNIVNCRSKFNDHLLKRIPNECCKEIGKTTRMVFSRNNMSDHNLLLS